MSEVVIFVREMPKFFPKVANINHSLLWTVSTSSHRNTKIARKSVPAVETQYFLVGSSFVALDRYSKKVMENVDEFYQRGPLEKAFIIDR